MESEFVTHVLSTRQADAPDPKKIPAEDVVGVTVVLIQALYREKEFIRVGYYLERHIIASDPRVTRFPIDWGDGLLDGCPEPEQTEEPDADEQLLMPTADVVGDDEDADDVDEDDEEEVSENVPEEGTTTGENALPASKRDMGGSDSFIVGTTGSGSSEPLRQVQSSAISMDTS
ncbi:unnamed protein product [Echinostoma caproni]|uniref:Uncharacterized protein n=1 Tax=Echinostoma caproni TaxID=27848 RepID=A0A3P8L3S0_9TREM|nr:unnamed protein product [Echinostoma caproni]